MKTRNLIFEDSQIMFKNFAGEKDQFNRAGDKEFSIRIEDEQLAEDLRLDGWNIKQCKQRDPEDPIVFYLKVTARFDNFPPKVYKVSGGRKMQLDNDTIGCLDDERIICADIEVSPYDWDLNGKTGRKAYLKTMFATVEQEAFADKYMDM